MKEIKLPKNYKYIAALLTMRCNLNCSFCLNAFEQGFQREVFQEISGEEWVWGLNRISSDNKIPITISGGEPSLHSDFLYIINNIKPELGIDILTNLMWGKKYMKEFIDSVDPNRLKRDAPYPSIRVSYHPEQMGDGKLLVKNALELQRAGFDIGIYAVQYPSKKQLEAITQMQFRCLNSRITFRVKDFTGMFNEKDDNGNYFQILYGNYSKYKDSVFQPKTKGCLCKTTELLIGTDGKVYRCHRDMFYPENEIGSILNEDFEIDDKFRICENYGRCHPCDVKVKTNYKQKIGHTSVEIKRL